MNAKPTYKSSKPPGRSKEDDDDDEDEDDDDDDHNNNNTSSSSRSGSRSSSTSNSNSNSNSSNNNNTNKNNKNSKNNKNNKNNKSKYINATNRCAVSRLQAAVWQEHHTVLCTCALAQSTWTTPTLTLLYITLMTSPVCEAIVACCQGAHCDRPKDFLAAKEFLEFLWSPEGHFWQLHKVLNKHPKASSSF